MRSFTFLTQKTPMGNQKLFRIMLTDDDLDDRDLFMEAVNANAVTLDFTENGVALMKSLHNSEQLPDCIFLDLNMPEKGGKECLREIREEPRLAHLPVIIYSTSSSRKDIDDTFALGANLYVVKPSSFVQIRETIESVLDLNWADYQPNTDKHKFVFSTQATKRT
jgi:CheY-like chemotaxis protein